MTKFTSLTAGVVVALLVICLSSITFAQPSALPSDLSSLIPSGPSPTGTDAGEPTEPAAATGGVSVSTLPNGGSYTVTGAASASPSPSGSPLPSAPTGTGSLIPGWSSALSAYGPSATSSPYPSQSPSAGGAKSAPYSGASKIENGLVSGVIIAGIVSLFL